MLTALRKIINIYTDSSNKELEIIQETQWKIIQFLRKEAIYRLNYIQHLVIAYNGEESEKRIIYLNHFTVHLKLTQHYQSAILQKRSNLDWMPN